VRQKYFHFKVTQTGEPSWLSKKGKRLKMSHWYRKYFRRLVTLFGLYLAPFFHWKLKMCWISLIVLVLALRFIHCTVVVVDLKLWRFSTDGIRREKARERLVCVSSHQSAFLLLYIWWCTASTSAVDYHGYSWSQQFCDHTEHVYICMYEKKGRSTGRTSGLHWLCTFFFY